jgi:thymidylate synthase
MDFESRKFNWRYLAGELAWYLKRNSKIDYINNFSTFWKNIVNEDGEANSNYGSILLSTHPSTVLSRDEDGYSRPQVNQMEWVYNSLVKDKDTRQAVAFLNCPYYQYEGNKDFVCTMYLNFWIRKDFLDMKVQMRSNDIFYGLSYDAPWFASLQQSLYLSLKKIYPGLKLGIYYHYADNIHYYDRHFNLVDNILDATLQDSIKLELKASFFDFDSDGKMFITDESKHFIEMVDGIVASGNIPKDQFYWREALKTLYKIS